MDIILRIIRDLTQVHPPHPLFVHFPIALTSGDDMPPECPGRKR